MEENSSINEKNRKLFLKMQSLVSSAQNFETLKLYEDSLKLYKEARDLANFLCKKPFIEENPQIKSFYSNFENCIENKLKILDQLNKISNQNNKSKIDESKMEQTTIPAKPEAQKEEVIPTINEMIKKCEENLKEIEENKKCFNKSFLMETTIINEKSFILPNIKNPKQFQKISMKGSAFPGDSSSSSNESCIEFLEQVEDKFKVIEHKLTQVKTLLDTENTLRERKEIKRHKLEKLKKNYSTLKQVQENALRNGQLKLKK